MPNVDLITPIHVDKTAFIRFDTNRYSVPAHYVCQTITLVADDQCIRLLDGAEPIAEHRRNLGRHQIIEMPEHRKSIIATKQRAAVPKGQQRLRNEVPNIEPLFECWFESGHNIGNMTLRTLRLLDLYGATILADAVAEMLARGTFDPGALAILCDQCRQQRKEPAPPMALDLAQHVVDRDVLQHDLGGYDV